MLHGGNLGHKCWSLGFSIVLNRNFVCLLFSALLLTTVLQQTVGVSMHHVEYTTLCGQFEFALCGE